MSPLKPTVAPPLYSSLIICTWFIWLCLYIIIPWMCSILPCHFPNKRSFVFREPGILVKSFLSQEQLNVKRRWFCVRWVSVKFVAPEFEVHNWQRLLSLFMPHVSNTLLELNDKRHYHIQHFPNCTTLPSRLMMFPLSTIRFPKLTAHATQQDFTPLFPSTPSFSLKF